MFQKTWMKNKFKYTNLLTEVHFHTYVSMKILTGDNWMKINRFPFTVKQLNIFYHTWFHEDHLQHINSSVQ